MLKFFRFLIWIWRIFFRIGFFLLIRFMRTYVFSDKKFIFNLRKWNIWMENFSIKHSYFKLIIYWGSSWNTFIILFLLIFFVKSHLFHFLCISLPFFLYFYFFLIIYSISSTIFQNLIKFIFIIENICQLSSFMLLNIQRFNFI